jgi:hypothetical protein
MLGGKPDNLIPFVLIIELRLSASHQSNTNIESYVCLGNTWQRTFSAE